MKKRRTTAAAFLLSSVMAVSVCTASMTALTVFAADSYTITINKPESDKATHTYEAYQVFKGDLSGSNDDVVLANIEWGTGVNGTALLAALQANTAFVTGTGDEAKNAFADCEDASDVADVIDAWENDSTLLRKFADVVGANLAAVTAASTAGSKTVTVTSPGYYFIKDKDNSLDDAEDGAYTDYILKVVESVTITAKEEVPTIIKQIVEDDTLKSANTASIGDTVNFQLDSKVPDMSAYNKYYFIINDDMCDGLTFNASSVNIYIADDLIASSYYEVQTGDAADGHTFQIVMKNFKALYGDEAGKAIKVTYSATLNERCDRSEVGNDNVVGLTYSNNPNHEYVGDNEPSDTPGDGDVTGKSPESTTKTYTTGLMLKKIDGKTAEVLAGAKFKLEGSGVNQVLIASVENFVEDENGMYYKLKDGTYTTVAPTAETADSYDSTTQKYSLQETVTPHTGEGANSYVEATTDSKGILTLSGLGAGTYTLTEIEAPAGYNKLANPIEIVITAEPTLEGPNWMVLKDGARLAKTESIFEFSIENNKGTTLPDTGGVGTTIFYIIGGSLVAGAVVLLITKKRMGAAEE